MSFGGFNSKPTGMLSINQTGYFKECQTKPHSHKKLLYRKWLAEHCDKHHSRWTLAFWKKAWEGMTDMAHHTSYGLDFEAMAKEEENRMDYENQENEFKSDEVLVEGLQQFKELNIHSQFNM